MNRILACSLVVLAISLGACERCSTCTYTTYDGVCTCSQDGVILSEVEYNDIGPLERQQIEDVCEQQSGCRFSEDMTTEQKEPCDYRKELEEKVANLEAKGWVCGDLN